jgi:hypothetical protein
MRPFTTALLVLYFLVGIITAAISADWLIQHLDSIPKVCPLRLMTGYLCSFCGMTHAWIYFWHGEWSLAWRENALSLILFLGAPIYLLTKLKSHYWTAERNKKLLGMSMIILVVYTIARNIPS